MANPASPELLERLLREHAAALELFASQWSPAPEDCVQEAFLELMRQPAVPEKIVPWLYRVVRNRAISHWRRGQRQRRHESAASRKEAWFAPSTEAAIDPAQVSEALASLPSDKRIITQDGIAVL